MRRRAFTLIEVVLACSLGAMVVLACVGVYSAMTRADLMLQARFDESAELARLQRTMQNAMGTLVLAPEETNLGAGAQGAGEAGADAADGEIEAASEEEGPRPRIILGPETSEPIASFTRRAAYAAGGGGGLVARPQRLELVLTRAPIRPEADQSPGWTAALAGLVEAEAARQGDEEETEELVEAGVRGAFILMPDDATVTGSRPRADRRAGWTIWWQPMDELTEPARVASGIAFCHWRAYFGGEMIDEHEAYSTNELPTFMELEVETLGGLYANFLFETVWTVAEDPAPETTGSENEANTGDGTGNGENGGRNGGQEGANGPRNGPRNPDGTDMRRPKPISPSTQSPRQRPVTPREGPRRPGQPGGGGGS